MYLLLPIFFMCLGTYAMASHTALGIGLGVLFTLFAGIEWRAYWIYRQHQQ